MANIHEKITIIGGSGTTIVAKALRAIRTWITIINTVFDSGGHTGQLRELEDIIAVGDLRRAIYALADESIPWIKLMEHVNADGTKFGNHLIAACMKLTGSVMEGINMACLMMGVPADRVLPISLDKCRLDAWMSDDSLYQKGESALDTRDPADTRHISTVYLTPPAHIYTKAYEAIAGADKIVFPPGDPYTSILPNTRVDGFKEAIKEAAKKGAKIGTVVNLLWKRVESPEWPASKFVSTLLKSIDLEKFDFVICNTGEVPLTISVRYKKRHSEAVFVDKENVEPLTKKLICEDLVDIRPDPKRGVDVVRHNKKVGAIIADI